MEDDWDGIAEWYAELVRGGSAMHRFSRDILLNDLPVNVIGLDVLDVGCGEGTVSRALAGLDAALESVRRVLRPHGFLVFTVPHPCFDAPGTETISTPGGMRRAVGDYFAEGHWRSPHPHSVRRAGNFHRALSTYVTAVLEHGFVLRSLDEPAPSDEVRAAVPHRLGLPPFLVIGATLR